AGGRGRERLRQALRRALRSRRKAPRVRRGRPAAEFPVALARRSADARSSRSRTAVARLRERRPVGTLDGRRRWAQPPADHIAGRGLACRRVVAGWPSHRVSRRGGRPLGGGRAERDGGRGGASAAPPGAAGPPWSRLDSRSAVSLAVSRSKGRGATASDSTPSPSRPSTCYTTERSTEKELPGLDAQRIGTLRPLARWMTSKTMPIRNKIHEICPASAAMPNNPRAPTTNT